MDEVDVDVESLYDEIARLEGIERVKEDTHYAQKEEVGFATDGESGGEVDRVGFYKSGGGWVVQAYRFNDDQGRWVAHEVLERVGSLLEAKVAARSHAVKHRRGRYWEMKGKKCETVTAFSVHDEPGEGPFEDEVHEEIEVEPVDHEVRILGVFKDDEDEVYPWVIRCFTPKGVERVDDPWMDEHFLSEDEASEHAKSAVYKCRNETGDYGSEYVVIKEAWKVAEIPGTPTSIKVGMVKRLDEDDSPKVETDITWVKFEAVEWNAVDEPIRWKVCGMGDRTGEPGEHSEGGYTVKVTFHSEIEFKDEALEAALWEGKSAKVNVWECEKGVPRTCHWDRSASH